MFFFQAPVEYIPRSTISWTINKPYQERVYSLTTRNQTKSDNRKVTENPPNTENIKKKKNKQPFIIQKSKRKSGGALGGSVG